MTIRHLTRFFLATVAFGASFAGPAAMAQCQYEITAIIENPVDCFGLQRSLIGLSLSDRGEVVGRYLQCPAEYEAFYWSEQTGVITLQRPPGVYSAVASDISEEGAIVGTYEVQGTGNRAFIYKDGDWTELSPVDPEHGWSWANAISDDGTTIVGGRSIQSQINPYNAYIWNDADGFTDLGVMNGPFSMATGVSNSGSIVGWTGIPQENEGFLWADGNNILIGPVPDGATSSPSGITEQGIIFGRGELRSDKVPVGAPQAFIWQRGRFEMLGTLPGFEISSAHGAIDNPIRVAGSSKWADGNPNVSRASVWTETDSKLHDLNSLVVDSLGLTFVSANAINSQGVILASGKEFASGPTVAVLLQPQVPIGDLTGDCSVNASDLEVLLDSWGLCEDCPADLNSDGTVDPRDLAALLDNWG